MIFEEKFVSYASNFEDVLINRLFPKTRTGFYVDIGADHPIYASTTMAFYERGWHGINVEPGPRWELLCRERLRDVNLNVAVNDVDGEVDFYLNEDVNSISSIFPEMNGPVRKLTVRRTCKRVKALTLNTIYSRYGKGQPIDFLKIDAEGAEEKIINSTDWSVVRPAVVIAESTEPFTNKRVDGAWSANLQRQGYIEAYFDGINTWFVRAESGELLDRFKVPVNVLDNFVNYHPNLTPVDKGKSGVVTDKRKKRRVMKKLRSWLGVSR